jgi:hypothetical protein
MEYKVFIQTNHKQYIGALAAAHALARYSKHTDKFSIEIIDVRDYPYFAEREGQIGKFTCVMVPIDSG